MCFSAGGSLRKIFAIPGKTMPALHKQFSITPGDFIRAGEVSIAIQTILKSIGFDPDIIRRASVCAYEAEMNVVMHGGDGALVLRIDTGSEGA